jgi:hypothetical protein
LPDVVNGYKWELYHITEDYSQYNDLSGADSIARRNTSSKLISWRLKSQSLSRSLV